LIAERASQITSIGQMNFRMNKPWEKTFSFEQSEILVVFIYHFSK